VRQFARTRRQKVVDLLEQVVASGSPGAQTELLEFVGQIGTKTYFQILDGIIAHSEGAVRILVCQMVMTSDNRPIPQQQAIHTLRQLAGQGSVEERILAITYLVETRNVHKELAPSLALLQERLEEDDHRRVLVAAAIYQALEWDDKGESEVLWHEAINRLLSALHSPQPAARLIAARALQHVDLHANQIRDSILECCQTASGPERCLLLSYLGKVAGREPEVVESLISFARQDRYDVETRIAAIHALGQTPLDRTDVDEVLAGLTQDEDWSIAATAIARLYQRRGTLPKEIVNRLVASVSHPSPGVRSLSAALLADIPETAVEIYPHLVQQLAWEDDGQAGEAILKALGRGGQAALKAVVEAIERAAPDQLHPYQVALIEISQHAVHDVAQLLTSLDGKVRGSAFSVLHTRGPLAKPIIPFLHQLLDAEDRETVQNALMLLRSIGPVSIECFEKFVELLQSSDQDIRTLAQATLLGIGPVCTASLRRARRKFPEWERDSLDEYLRLLVHTYESEDLLLAGVDGVTDENDLELFCLVADLLLERGPMSFRDLSKELQQQSGQLFRESLPCSEGQIRLTIQRLEKIWGDFWGIPVRLIDRSGTRKGGLSEEMGYRYFRRSQEYLDRLRIVRGKQA